VALDLQVQQVQPPRQQRIRAVFEAHGQMMTIRDLARACVDDGIWTREELDRIALRSVANECREVLRQKDVAGMPKAGQTTDADDDGQSVWKARQGWLFDDYVLNVREHLGLRDENHTVAAKLAAEAVARYRIDLDIPGLPEVDA